MPNELLERKINKDLDKLLQIRIEESEEIGIYKVNFFTKQIKFKYNYSLSIDDNKLILKLEIIKELFK